MSTQEEIRAAAERLKANQLCRKDCKHLYNAHRMCQWCNSMQRDIDVMAVAEAYIAEYADTPITPELIAEVGLDGDSVFGSDNIRFDYFPPNKELHLVQYGDIVSISLKNKSKSQLLALLKGLGK